MTIEAAGSAAPAVAVEPAGSAASQLQSLPVPCAGPSVPSSPAAPASKTTRSASAPPEIRLRGVGVNLDGADVLRGVDFEAAAGEWINIVGANGAGKTTLLRALLGLVSYSGDITVAGLQGRRHRRRRARKLAYVPQAPVVPPGMHVSDYVLLGRVPHRGVFAGETPEDVGVVIETLARLDLSDFAGRTVQSLSGGERQRVVIARALAQQADVLLLDEPTTALDLGHQQEVLELVQTLRLERGLTVVATLHDLTLAARYGDRVAIISDGSVVATGPPAEVLTTDNIAAHFGATVRIIDDLEGPVIVPTAGLRSEQPEHRRPAAGRLESHSGGNHEQKRKP
ncbi:MAG: ABC transporter ATP-binding protein [Acidimicrobiaceae bacterium]|nr:ABC transporter ATP-binding protein [Acidimicrobiaceae bacterium]MCY4176158.1 ABC transporter ATP-binding protein [Acidimicrobiaceae bacterium]MCY4280390.1 ABC transporter ATP-binding protein [Acidimicrobiaceae bacterium]MCY4294361.1 ABC transporter ATP-binding protein [Acidimicrobiaceae bacterium]